MKNYILIVAFLTLTTFTVAQNKIGNLDYNKWSLEVSVGQNKPIRPFADGFYSSDPKKSISFSKVSNFNMGIRYMLSNSFGFKLDYAMDQFNEQSGAGSLPFDTQSSRIGLQGVMNLGHLLRFDSFTNRVGLLTHAGFHLDHFSVKEGINRGVKEFNGGIMFGLTPIIKINHKIAVSADFTVVNNFRQHLNWDGSVALAENNLSGLMYNTSIGLTYYLGSKLEHADWSNVEQISDRNFPKQKSLTSKKISKSSLITSSIEDTKNSEDTTSSLENQILYNQILEQLNSKNYFDINFEINSQTVDISKSNIKEILKALNNFPDSKINLTAHSPIKGGNNISLSNSKKRVRFIKQLLVKNGINEDRFNNISAELPKEDENIITPYVRIELSK